MKTKPKKYPLGLWFFVATILTGLLCYICANTMPYLLNMNKMWIYFYCSFPFVLAFFIYFVFFHKWATTGHTGFEMRYSVEALENSTYKTKQALIAIGLLTILSAILAWASWGIVACGSYIYSKEPFKFTYLVISLKGEGNLGVGVGLVDPADGSEYSLKQAGYYLTLGVPWQVGDHVCAKGRTSFLGTIVDDFKVGECAATP
jgi:hypothetical protein